MQRFQTLARYALFRIYEKCLIVREYLRGLRISIIIHGNTHNAQVVEKQHERENEKRMYYQKVYARLNSSLVKDVAVKERKVV